MSKIALEPNAAGTGTVTIASPATNTNRTLTLPDEAGTVLTSASAIDAAQITGLSSGGVTLLGTLTTTSGTSVTLSGLTLTDYKFLQFFVNAVSSSAAPAYLLLNAYQVAVVDSSIAEEVGYGGGFIDLSNGVFQSSFAAYAPTYLAAQGGRGGPSGLTTASTSITFTITSGNFDAGSIKIYGVA